MNKILIFLGIILGLYGGLAVFILGSGQWFNFAFVIIGAALILIGIIVKIKAVPGWLKAILLILLILAIAATAFFEYRIIKFASAEPEEGADYVIVLGAKVNGSTPSVEFSARIKAATAYLLKNPGTKVITTGAKGEDEDISEAAAAAKVILAARVLEDRIIIEDKSTTTLENLANAAEIIRQRGKDPAKTSIVVVSSGFHLYRASLYAKELGLENVSYSGGNGMLVLLPQYYLREFAALVKELLAGQIHL